MTYTPPDPATYSIPSPARRAVVAALYLVPSLLLFVVLPYVGLTELANYGVSSGYSLGLILVLGLVLAALSAAASYARPTAAYGPLLIAGSLVGIVYLLSLARDSSLSFGIGSGSSLTLVYGGMLTLFAVVPTIRIGTGVMTTLEDVLRPKERLPFDFPAGP